MRVILAGSALILAASLAACSGGSSESFSTNRTPQSESLTSPGSVEITSSGSTVTLVGGNTTSGGCSGAQFGFNTAPCTVSAAYLAGGRTVSFDWNYATSDTAGPGADIFGIVVDGRVMQISDPGGSLKQSGHVDIVAQNYVQFFLNCTDCTDGAATAIVSALTR